MKTISFDARPRAEHGKGASRKSRRDGWIPAVLYGDTVEGGLSLSVSLLDYRKVAQQHLSENVLLDLTIEGEKSPRKAIVRDVQVHPFRGEVLHLDFLQINLSKEITVTVPIHVVGEPAGVKDQGGVLDVSLRELEIECLPLDIPDDVKVDVSGLMIGDGVHVRDLTLEKGKILTDVDRMVASVVPPTVLVVEEEAAPAAAAADVPEVGKEEKSEESGGDEE